MKQAKEEASLVIDQYKTQKESEFASSSSTLTSTSQSSAELELMTKKEMEVMAGQFEKNQSKALQLLLAKCCEVSTEVPAARIRSAQKAQAVAAAKAAKAR